MAEVHHIRPLSHAGTHDGHPVLRWTLDSIYIRQDHAGNIKPDKAKSIEKIDAAMGADHGP